MPKAWVLDTLTAELLGIMSAPRPFSKWGIHIVGPFPRASSRRFLIVVRDYFSKWVEAELNVVSIYGWQRDLVSDNGAQFQGQEIRSWLKGMKVRQHFTAVAHPQANGQVEVTNRTLVRGIKARLDRAGGGWVDELNRVMGETPFSLVYGAEALIPAEIGMETHRIHTFEEDRNEELMREALDELEEKRQRAYLRMEASKGIMKASYDKRVKKRNFQVGDMVLRRADALKLVGKLEANWEGPYKVVRIAAGGAYELENMAGQKVPRPWNVCHLNQFHM
ncbi:hypothetical protein DH2020_028525 [Rehmannia glutinosa]|uniref:Integrase catalytic domain-containing protein n=1 Tax=Rehmannia glutinosa TaxID=99300 RepID=A0ABR0VSW1_REHGL